MLKCYRYRYITYTFMNEKNREFCTWHRWPSCGFGSAFILTYGSSLQRVAVWLSFQTLIKRYSDEMPCSRIVLEQFMGNPSCRVFYYTTVSSVVLDAIVVATPHSHLCIWAFNINISSKQNASKSCILQNTHKEIHTYYFLKNIIYFSFSQLGSLRIW